MIRREELLSVLSYVGVGAFSLALALWISSSLLTPAQTQEDPNMPQVETPPEDPNTVEGDPSEAALPEDPAAEPPPPGAGEPSLGDEASAQKEQIRAEIQSFLEPFIYDPKGRRDPFKPYTEVLPAEESDMPAGPVMPLQRFDLDQLQLIGIIWDVRDPKAMFLDPNSRIYTVGRDERIGRNNGYVAAIREGEVVVIEAFRRREGETLYTPRVIRMER